MPPAAVMACMEAIDILSESTEFTDKLWDNAKYLKAGSKQSRL